MRALVVIGLALTLLASVGIGRVRAQQRCAEPRADQTYTRDVMQALAATRDVWGERLLAAPDGPTYEATRRYVQPLLYARGPHQRPLTESGVYYLPFAEPPGPAGASTVELHVADGSQILAQRVGGRSLTILVGARGGERYGSCLARLTPARLLDGYLPVLETAYVDTTGTSYRQESFAAWLPGTQKLASFVALTADARRASTGVEIRFAPSATSVAVGRGAKRDIYVAWLPGSSPTELRVLDEESYESARNGLVGRWQRRLSRGMTISVPERRVEDARRALLVQDLVLGWRYSVGNQYQEFSFPEGPDVAQVMGEQGFGDVERAILESSLTRSDKGYPHWKQGQRLLVSAAYYRLFRDAGYVERAAPALRGYVAALERDLQTSGPRILARERYSADIPDSVYGLHAQTVAWAGLRAMASVWAETGHSATAAKARRLATRLEPGLRAAVHASERRLPDGSLFVPARLLDPERPYRSLVEARPGSYWNLVTPFALSSGFFPPRSPYSHGILRYLLSHGSRLLGLVRAGAYALYGRDAPFPVSGTDEVYGVNVSRFLADNDESDQLVLSMYGQLAAAMTPQTYVAGEGASITPLDGLRYRAMYLPPNAASNAAFLETLRLMLVHEAADGLELAYATPRGWLHPGRRITVVDAPTSFGPVSFSITVAARSAHLHVDVPRRFPPKHLSTRLRLPHGLRIDRVSPRHPFSSASGTIDLSGVRGSIDLDVRLVAA